MRLFTPVIFSSILFVVGCAGNSTVSRTADINKYQYVVLPNVLSYNGDPELMDLEMQIYDALELTRLTVIGEKEIYSLTEDQKQRLLLARFSARQNSDYSRISVNFTDFVTGRPVASCYGAYALGFDESGDLDGAMVKVSEEINKLF